MRVFILEPDLLSVLAHVFTEDTEDNRNRILEILECIPDTMKDEKIVIEDELREKFVQYTVDGLQANVLKTLELASNQPNLSEKRKYQLFKCFSSWITDKTREDVKEVIHTLNVFKLCFLELIEPCSCNTEAADTLITIMNCCKDTEKYQSLYQVIIQNLFESQSSFNRFLLDDDMSEEVKSFLDVYSVLFNKIFNQAIQDPTNEAVRTILYDVFLKVYEKPGLQLVPLCTNIFITILRKVGNEKNEKLSENELQMRASFAESHIPLFKVIIEKSVEYSRFSAVISS